MDKDQIIVMNLCGRGDKDVFAVAEASRHGYLILAAGRIDRRFAALKDEGRPALVTFVMAGDPDYDTSLAIVGALPKAGADLIELGMPFSDPMADGPAIQASGLRALKAGRRSGRRWRDGARLPRERDDDADRADGLLQPDLHLRQRALSSTMRRKPASTA
jgi:hypothetical protein